MNNIQKALEFRKALQYFVATIDVETNADMAIEISTVYPIYEVGKKYYPKSDTRPADVFSYGVNEVGDPQLYMVLQEHTSQAEWTPDTAVSLYKAVGVTEEGIPIWVQPLGAEDAYDFGDKVMHNDVIWTSTVDANTWEPGVYGWEQI